MLDPQPVARDEPAVRTHLDIAHVLAVLAAQMIEDVLGGREDVLGGREDVLGGREACLRLGRGSHAHEAAGPG